MNIIVAEGVKRPPVARAAPGFPNTLQRDPDARLSA